MVFDYKTGLFCDRTGENEVLGYKKGLICNLTTEIGALGDKIRRICNRELAEGDCGEGGSLDGVGRLQRRNNHFHNLNNANTKNDNYLYATKVRL